MSHRYSIHSASGTIEQDAEDPKAARSPEPAALDPFEQDLEDVANVKAIPTILDIVCRLTGMRFAAVARVTETRWIALSVRDDIAFGLRPGGELKVETTLCHEIRQSGEAIIIDDVGADETYCHHHTPAFYGLKSYISMPILLPDGAFFGTLCAIDPEPRRLKTPETIEMFEMFAEIIGAQLGAARRTRQAEASLFDERATAALREQFIAVLGHDLRNPLASIDGGVRLLQKEPQSDKSKYLLGLMAGSVLRMSGLIDNVLDFARGRLGGGITLERGSVELEPLLNHVVEEIRLVAPGRAVEMEVDLSGPVRCDPSRIGQLVSNLLGNAILHGEPGAPVRLAATADRNTLTIAIANEGTPIASETMPRLFQPFFRGGAKEGQAGLGLGLHISAEIAKAHGGRIDVLSTAQETRFTFTMPLPR
ncbi:GAF domain-containing sensor histidine kinase [Acuticoccus kandeliae]|uniref:GAF domain-containing sensor histidine kinase n=1 Tax=Acuticoccus kandeliae TaxID=2073160 RepID=UPI000D3E9991|nr:GAF domain-containing sensor histidine kinase [Acuticoccus kandeliae]